MQPIRTMYDLCRWKFLHKIHQNFTYGATLLKHLDIGTDYFECVYNCHIRLMFRV